MCAENKPNFKTVPPRCGCHCYAMLHDQKIVIFHFEKVNNWNRWSRGEPHTSRGENRTFELVLISLFININYYYTRFLNNKKKDNACQEVSCECKKTWFQEFVTNIIKIHATIHAGRPFWLHNNGITMCVRRTVSWTVLNFYYGVINCDCLIAVQCRIIAHSLHYLH